MRRRTELTVESLTAYRVLDKLARENIPVYRAREERKNSITFEVETDTLEKVFAILRGSCYNVKKTRFRGLTLLYKKCLSSVGLLVGLALFCLCVLGAQTRVLKIEVVGSGSYYAEEVLGVLERGGVKKFSAAPKNTATLTAEILAFPRVSYCSIAHNGGILTVEVRVSDENGTLPIVPLYAPAAGVIEELVVVRGTPLVAVGDEVERGQILVDCSAVYGETARQVIVIARVKISFAVSAEYGGTEEEAKSSAYLEYGVIEDIHTEKTANGWLVTGKAFSEAAINLD